MADIFSAQPGKVTAVLSTGLPMQIIIGNPLLFDVRFGLLADNQFRGPGVSSFDTFRAIIQGIGVSGHGGFQFRHTLRDYIYVYVFGERVGELLVTGLAFHSSCTDAFNPAVAATGFEHVLNYYKVARITSYPLALTIGIGATVSFDAFLIGVDSQIIDPSTNLAQFTLKLLYIPDRFDLLPDEGPDGVPTFPFPPPIGPPVTTDDNGQITNDAGQVSPGNTFPPVVPPGAGAVAPPPAVPVFVPNISGGFKTVDQLPTVDPNTGQPKLIIEP